MTVPESLRRGPVLLRPDNFVPFTRTPWGGKVLAARYKRAFVPEPDTCIGEAWEFSCDPAFPSRLASSESGIDDLAGLVQSYPAAVLSPARVARGETTIDVLVKLLDTAAPLSLQVHPADGDPRLAAHESGKPESWLVLDAEPGAGIYLGFSRSLTRHELESAIVKGEPVQELLHFEAVQAGDYFEIEPGVPHLIGAGVTLLEPQRVLAGKAGKTLRLWDWNRRYDDQGRLDPKGTPRTLHLADCWDLIDPQRQVGADFASRLRRRPRTTARNGVEVRTYPANQYYQVSIVSLAPGAEATLAIQDGYGVLLVLDGAIASRDLRLVQGQPALLPHAAMPIHVKAEPGSASILAIVTPADSPLSQLA